MKRVVLKPGRERSLLRRHPWIYSGAVASGDAGRGETVEVVSSAGETLGFGSFSPDSQIRVRMLSFGAAPAPGEAYVASLVADAVKRRERRLAEGGTAACRLVHAEGDGLPGVVADWYAGWVVCQFTSAGAERWKRTVVDALAAALPGLKGVAERSDVEVRAREGLPVGGFSILSGGEPPDLVEISEGGCRYLVDVRRGHKTGFYLDQRLARAAVGAIAAGREVLNCFSYTGGFGIAAMRGGAASVVNVDASADALALASRNAALNECEKGMSFEEGDVFKYLRKCRDMGRSFDMIVLDPPKFAESKAQVMKAARGYKDINLLAMKLLRKGGVLATFSCSGAMTPELFQTILAEAAADARRDFAIVERTFQAEDHPASLAFPDGLYLKGYILAVR